MVDSFDSFLEALFAGEGWAVAVAFVTGLIIIWMINRMVELYGHIHQWFQPVPTPAPQPMQDTPSGCARFGSCVWSAFRLMMIVLVLVLFLAWLVAGDALRDFFSGFF